MKRRSFFEALLAGVSLLGLRRDVEQSQPVTDEDNLTDRMNYLRALIDREVLWHFGREEFNERFVECSINCTPTEFHTAVTVEPSRKHPGMFDFYIDGTMRRNRWNEGFRETCRGDIAKGLCETWRGGIEINFTEQTVADRIRWALNENHIFVHFLETAPIAHNFKRFPGDTLDETA